MNENRLLNKIKKHRQWLHQHPELGFKENKTSAYLIHQLKRLKWKVTAPIAKTGVVANLINSRNKPCIALRADMDGLPISETTRVKYKSLHPGKMHACGHDANMAMVLGVAEWIKQYESKLTANVKLIFQPCEETPPGGAQRMIAAGVLENPQVSAIYALHMDPRIKLNYVGIKSGVLMGSADEFKIRLTGKGGHAALPHQCVDSIVAASQLIMNSQQIIAREINPLDSGVMSFGEIHAGCAFNVVAPEAFLSGTIRAVTPRTRIFLIKRLQQVLTGLSRANRTKVSFDLVSGYPPLYNNPELIKKVMTIMQTHPDMEIKKIRTPILAGEDFAFYTEKVPGCLILIGGQSNASKHAFPWHHSKFNFDERALLIGTRLLTRILFHEK